MANEIYEDGTYARNNPGWHEDDSAWKAGHLSSILDDQVIDEFRAQGTIKVAEIGCGFAGVLAGVCAYLEQQGVNCDMTGCDLSEFALDSAAQRYPNMTLVKQNFLETDETYDLGMMIDFFEHVENPKEFLQAAAQRFQWTLFHIPLDENFLGKFMRRGYYYKWLEEDRGHINYYTPASAMKLLRESGHQIVNWKFTPWGLELGQGGGRSAPIIKAMRWVGSHTSPSMSARVLGGASLACLCRSSISRA